MTTDPPQSAQTAALVARLGDALGSAVAPSTGPALLHEVVAQVRTVFGAAACSFAQVEPDGASLRFVAAGRCRRRRDRRGDVARHSRHRRLGDDVGRADRASPTSRPTAASPATSRSRPSTSRPRHPRRTRSSTTAARPSAWSRSSTRRSWQATARQDLVGAGAGRGGCSAPWSGCPRCTTVSGPACCARSPTPTTSGAFDAALDGIAGEDDSLGRAGRGLPLRRSRRPEGGPTRPADPEGRGRLQPVSVDDPSGVVGRLRRHRAGARHRPADPGRRGSGPGVARPERGSRSPWSTAGSTPTIPLVGGIAGAVSGGAETTRRRTGSASSTGTAPPTWSATGRPAPRSSGRLAPGCGDLQRAGARRQHEGPWHGVLRRDRMGPPAGHPRGQHELEQQERPVVRRLCTRSPTTRTSRTRCSCAPPTTCPARRTRRSSRRSSRSRPARPTTPRHWPTTRRPPVEFGARGLDVEVAWSDGSHDRRRAATRSRPPTWPG